MPTIIQEEMKSRPFLTIILHAECIFGNKSDKQIQ